MLIQNTRRDQFRKSAEEQNADKQGAWNTSGSAISQIDMVG